MKQKRIITEDFFIGNLGNKESPDEIRDTYFKLMGDDLYKITKYDFKGQIGENENDPINEKIRNCYVSWLNVSETNFIETGLRKIIENVNKIIWNKKLEHKWETNIQFTKYIGKGDHYNWHKDCYEEENENVSPNFRRISVVYCLSKKSDYTGGEFQIRTKNNGVYTTKFDYGDFIVFPSDKLHRVKPLKSGSRITMVGWYR